MLAKLGVQLFSLQPNVVAASQFFSLSGNPSILQSWLGAMKYDNYELFKWTVDIKILSVY